MQFEEGKFQEKMYFVDIFFCLFCNFRGSKPIPARGRKTEKNKEMTLVL
jgi:hypothetical protein